MVWFEIERKKRIKRISFFFWLVCLVRVKRKKYDPLVHILYERMYAVAHFHCNKKFMVADTAKLIKRDRSTIFHVRFLMYFAWQRAFHSLRLTSVFPKARSQKWFIWIKRLTLPESHSTINSNALTFNIVFKSHRDLLTIVKRESLSFDPTISTYKRHGLEQQVCTETYMAWNKIHT